MIDEVSMSAERPGANLPGSGNHRRSIAAHFRSDPVNLVTCSVWALGPRSKKLHYPGPLFVCSAGAKFLTANVCGETW
jgi:hypothetical protein